MVAKREITGALGLMQLNAETVPKRAGLAARHRDTPADTTQQDYDPMPRGSGLDPRRNIIGK